MPIDSIPARFLDQALRRPTRPAYYVREDSGWKATTWNVFVDEVRQVARALIASGFEAGDKVCILGFNRPEWTIFDLATMVAGGTPAGIYTTCSPSEVQYILNHAEAKVVLVEDEGQWEKVKAERERLPQLERVVTMKGVGAIDDDMVMDWDAFLALGDSVESSAVDARVEGIQGDQLATMIYTSGTTGPPKAVMLSHDNLAWTANLAVELVGAEEHDSCVSYLPLAHIAEQMFSLHVPVSVGSQVYFARSIELLKDDIGEVHPTIFFGVPRIWEKFYAGLSSKLSMAEGGKAKLVAWAQCVGRRAVAARNAGESLSLGMQLRYKLANKLVFSKVKGALGLDRAKICVSGAAPIGAEVLEFLAGLDIAVHEVYGQSEDTGPTSFNLPGATKFGTVGRPIPGVQVRIAEDGEIMVSGPNVFQGYYKDQEATDEALSDGWLHSGDLGELDEDGYLCITGRKKDIIITAGGKNITPKNIEAALKNIEWVAEAVLIGDRRKFISALLTLDEEAVARFAESRGVSVEGIHEDAALLADIQTGVDAVNAQFARVEHVRKFTVLDRPFSIEAGELTPTLKVKRRIVYDNFADVIEAMYAG